MIPTLAALGEKLDLITMLVPLALAGLLTGMLFLALSIAEWFNDRNP